MKREVVYNPLKMVDGIYEMDFDHLESIIDDKCKVFDPLQPSQSGQVVWKKENLGPIGRDLHQAVLHLSPMRFAAEMAYPRYTHYPFASVSDTAASCSVAFMAPARRFSVSPVS